ncbi:Fumarylacetoacetate hydrolase domain-containing protein 2 [Colletotrichum sidae]|uniref:Fumarylacetoacetate hydrolase domain-containing protein 2 n=1 Tax=Colletotrichum sidae TaxID=1347389 RepID=A0A4R8TEJ6_9PEZI|nr:Fumarylacetoacetate hydrolase domain-containing protein 2 [Colletotrichum sidae]
MAFQLVTYPSNSIPIGGVHVNGRVYALADVLGATKYATVLDALKEWDIVRPKLEQFAGEPSIAPPKSLALREVDLLAPIPNPGTVFCAGGNYNDHGGEMDRVMNLKPVPNLKQRGQPPFFFLKNATGVCGPNSVTKADADDLQFDWELELTVIIGRLARNVTKEKALDYVAGFTVGNDLSFRKYVRRPDMHAGEPFEYDWFRQKSFDNSCPIGPWIVPAKQVTDVQNLEMKLWVGDELMQDTSTSKMIFTVAEQVEELSRQLNLHPGDIIMTGTGAGVGMGRGRFLQRGETVRAQINGIGEFTHRIG